jgi:hypothetical protein
MRGVAVISVNSAFSRPSEIRKIDLHFATTQDRRGYRPLPFPRMLLDGPVVNFRDGPTARLQSVTPGYFHALRIPLRRGRYFTEEDSTSVARAGAVVNESFVRRFWPAYPRCVNSIGQHLLGSLRDSCGSLVARR